MWSWEIFLLILIPAFLSPPGLVLTDLLAGLVFITNMFPVSCRIDSRTTYSHGRRRRREYNTFGIKEKFLILQGAGLGPCLPCSCSCRGDFLFLFFPAQPRCNK